MTAAIEINNLTKRFGSLTAVNNVSLRVAPGAIFGLLGPNGSGKSTIIRMLCGVLPPSSGNATVLGYHIPDDAELVKEHIGYMSQKFSLYPDLTVEENLHFYGRIYGVAEVELKAQVERVANLTTLEGKFAQQAGTLSGGWKQRLALACSLIHNPTLIFLDEPTAGIDPVARRELWDLLFRLSALGKTLFVTTHYMDEAERCTDIGYIYQSELILCGKPAVLKALPEVNPSGTKRFRLRAPNVVSRLQEIRHFSGVRDATLMGEAIHLLLEDQVNTNDLITSLGADSPAATIEQVTPSLEDVFVSLTQAANRNQIGRMPEISQGTKTNNEAQAAAQAAGGKELVQTENRRQRLFSGFLAILMKEFIHIRRERSTLLFMFAIPVIQLTIFGYAIDTKIEHIPTVVWNLDERAESRRLLESFESSRTFTVVERAHNDEEFRRAITAGRAKVGILVPPDFSERVLRQEQAQVQVLIDGSDSQVATSALTATKLLGLVKSIERGKQFGEQLQLAPARDASGKAELAIDIRPRVLFNPDFISARFFVPGLVCVILQLVTLFLTAFSVVKEREFGTLEQLFVTPVGKAGLVLGKLVPYTLTSFVEALVVLNVMVYVFGVPIQGSLSLLLCLVVLFILCSLGLGLLISTLAKTQVEAMQFAFMIMLPSILLSGFVFPRGEMPTPIYLLTFAIPATYFVEIVRGIVLRTADFRDLLPYISGLFVCTVVVLAASLMRFRKQIS